MLYVGLKDQHANAIILEVLIESCDYLGHFFQPAAFEVLEPGVRKHQIKFSGHLFKKI